MELTDKIVNNRYKIKDKIGESGMSIVWLAEDIFKKENVAIKVLKRGVTSNRSEDIIRLRNETTAVSQLNEPGIAKIFEIGEVENMHYIVMEYVKGKSLAKMLEEGMKFFPNEAVEIVFRICEALKHVHNINVVHRDLKPGNIIIHWETNEPEVKLIDFGLAQVKEFNIKDTEEVICALSYMSPEQSGIIKRNVDERSDLYSLGIIFYELLTGELPFTADNVITLIHQQIAKLPERPAKFNPAIAEILEKIVLKLLAKEPEKRYHSATGLLIDLEKYRRGQHDFVPGVEDKFIKLNYRTNLIGRDDELQKLKNLFDKALQGNGSICLIGGEAGLGKTRLAEEIRNYVYEKQGMFIDGECFSGKNKIPYAPFKNALNLYIREFNKQYEEDKKSIRTTIKNIIGDLGQVLLKLDPALEEITGECSPLVELEEEQENLRFLKVTSQFIYCLGKIENALVILLDDLQWSDEGSLELLHEISKEISETPVLIIGTYRSNEITEKHGLKQFIKDAADYGYPLTNILLNTFDYQKMNKFISNLLFDTEENSFPLSYFILQKSNGNLFFAIEILKQIVEEKALVRKEGKWQLISEILDRMEIPSTIVDILIKKISLLNDQEINILSFAAVMGRKFDIQLLFSLGVLDKEEIVKVIDRAVKLQLLEYDFQEKGKILFAHDRIREAFYQNINDDKVKALHLKIAAAIEGLYKNSLEKVIFDLAYHYFEGEDKEKVLEYSFPAAVKSRGNYAHEEAVKHFQIVIDLLEQKGQTGSVRWFECSESIGEIYLTIGKIDDAIALFNRLLPCIKTKLNKANAYKQLSYAYFKKGDWDNCEKNCRLGLVTLGEKLPVSHIQVTLIIIKETLIRGLTTALPMCVTLRARFMGEISVKQGTHSTGAPSPRYEKARLIVWLYYILAESYSKSGSYKFISSVLKLINICETTLGKSKELGLSLTAFATFLAEMSRFKPALIYHNQALTLRKELNDEWGIGQSNYYLGFYYKCKGKYYQSMDYFINGCNIAKKIGDITELGAAISGLAGSYIFLADYTKAKITTDQFYDLVFKMKDNFGMIVSFMYNAIYYMEKGDFENAEFYGAKGYKLSFELKNWYACCMMKTILGKLYVEKGEFDKAIEYLEEAKKIYEKHRFLKEYTVLLYPYLADAYLEKYCIDKEGLSKKEVVYFLFKIKNACWEASLKTRSWVTWYGNSLRVNAKYYVLIGANKKAEKLFLRSIKLNKEVERKYELAICFFEYSKFLEQTGKKEDARKNMESAYTIFKDIGSKRFEKKIASLLGISGENPTSSIERFTRELRYTQKLSSIIRLTQNISSILNFDELLERIMSVAIEVTGAQRGYIMMEDGKTGEIVVTSQKNIDENIPQVDYYSKNIINEVMKTGNAIVTTNAMEDRKYRLYQSVVLNELRSIICVPVKYNNQVKGICYLDNPLSSAVFNEEDVEVLNPIMIQAAISIENAKLYKLAITDGLTELVTFKHFEFLLQKELMQADRSHQSISLIMFDIDHFKIFNDTYGHQLGDLILSRIAKIAKANFRNIDIIARYGGDEFVIILPSTDSSGALIFAEKLRHAVEITNIPFQDKQLKATISLGIAAFPVHASDMSSLIKAADEALYISKMNGRNRSTLKEKN